MFNCCLLCLLLLIPCLRIHHKVAYVKFCHYNYRKVSAKRPGLHYKPSAFGNQTI